MKEDLLAFGRGAGVRRLAGCTSPPEVKYYSIAPAAALEARRRARERRLARRPLRRRRGLRDERLAYRQGAHELGYDPYARWRGRRARRSRTRSADSSGARAVLGGAAAGSDRRRESGYDVVVTGRVARLEEVDLTTTTGARRSSSSSTSSREDARVLHASRFAKTSPRRSGIRARSWPLSRRCSSRRSASSPRGVVLVSLDARRPLTTASSRGEDAEDGGAGDDVEVAVLRLLREAHTDRAEDVPLGVVGARPTASPCSRSAVSSARSRSTRSDLRLGSGLPPASPKKDPDHLFPSRRCRGSCEFARPGLAYTASCADGRAARGEAETS